MSRTGCADNINAVAVGSDQHISIRSFSYCKDLNITDTCRIVIDFVHLIISDNYKTSCAGYKDCTVAALGNRSDPLGRHSVIRSECHHVTVIEPYQSIITVCGYPQPVFAVFDYRSYPDTAEHRYEFKITKMFV